MSTTRLIFIRHGITDWNSQKKFQGHTDIPLNEEGRKQAHITSENLKNIPIDYIYSSDLSRAYETAMIVTQYHQLPIHKTKKLRETNYGIWEGLTMAEIKIKYPDLIDQSNKDPLNIIYPTGESRGIMLERVYREIGSIINKHPGKSIAIISHEGAIAAMVCSLLGLDFITMRREYRLDNTRYHILEQKPDGSWTLSHKGHKSIQASDRT